MYNLLIQPSEEEFKRLYSLLTSIPAYPAVSLVVYRLSYVAYNQSQVIDALRLRSLVDDGLIDSFKVINIQCALDDVMNVQLTNKVLWQKLIYYRFIIFLKKKS